MRDLRFLPLLLLFVPLGGCFDEKVPVGTQIECHNNDQCPANYLCNTAIQRCVVSISSRTPKITDIATDSARYSAQTGHDLVTLTFDVDEQVDLSGISVTVRGQALHCLAYTSTPPNYTCTFTVTGAPGDDGERQIDITVRNSDGNSAEAHTPVAFDFTGPQVAAGTVSLQLLPGPDNPLSTVSAAAVGTTVVATFVLDESVSADPTVATSTPEALPFTLKTSAGTLFSYEATLQPGAHAQGQYAIEVTAVDVVGNASTTPLPLTFLVATQAPRTPDVASAGRVVYQRVPWGSDATAGARQFSVEGLAGAVEGGVMVRGLDGPVPDSAVEIGRTTAAADGSFHLALARYDRNVVYLATVDGAGNQSAAMDVKDVSWTATLNGKVAGSTFANPHYYETRSWFMRRWSQADAQEVASTSTVSRLDGTVEATAAAGDWEARHLGTVPYHRWGFPSVYDSARNRIVFFGGGKNSGLAETWEYDGAGWTLRTPLDPEGDGDPPARMYSAMAYDSARARVVLFGGCDDANCLTGGFGDTWEWDGASWALRAATDPAGLKSPSARAFHAMAYDESRQKVVLFGGGFKGFFDVPTTDDTWEWDGASWTRVARKAGWPSARTGHGLAYDRARKKVVMFGGAGKLFLQAGCSQPLCTVGVLGETWEYDGTDWKKIAFAGSTPPARLLHSMAWDSARHSVVIIGGDTSDQTAYDASGHLVTGDTWGYDGTSWTPLVATDPSGVTCPSPRTGAGMAFDEKRGVAVLFGGGYAAPTDASVTVNAETWEFDGTAWTQRQPSASPAARAAHGMAFDAARGVTVLFGGAEDQEQAANGETWEWDGTSWAMRAPPDPTGLTRPFPRAGHTAAFDSVSGKVVLYGGCVNLPCFVPPPLPSALLSDTWEWDGASGTWTPFPVPPAPPARSYHAMAWDGSRAVVFGGNSSDILHTNLLGDTWTRSGGAWTMATAGAGDPPALWRLAMVNDGARVIVFGGVDAANKTHGETWGRDATHWTLLAPAGGSSPAARALHAMAYDSDRKKVVLFAGQESTGAGDTDTWEWNGTSWAKITPSDPTADGSPPMRVFHAMVYDSKRHRVVLFGGLNTNDFMSDTWEYDFGPSARPAQVARFVFAAAEAETGATVQSVTANWSTGGQGDLGGVSTPGAKAWYFDKGTFVPDKSNSANVGTSAPLQWTSSDPAQLARIFNGQGKEIAVAVTPVGANAADSAKVAVDYVELVVQYRRP